MKKYDCETLEGLVLSGILDIYEQVDSFAASMNLIRSNEELAKNPISRNIRGAVFISTMVAMRCLNEFFKPNPRKDDIRAMHYEGYKSQEGFLDKHSEDLINKGIAHISSFRKTAQNLYLDEILEPLYPKMLSFLTHLQKHFLRPDHPESARIQRLISKLNSPR